MDIWRVDLLWSFAGSRNEYFPKLRDEIGRRIVCELDAELASGLSRSRAVDTAARGVHRSCGNDVYYRIANCS